MRLSVTLCTDICSWNTLQTTNQIICRRWLLFEIKNRTHAQRAAVPSRAQLLWLGASGWKIESCPIFFLLCFVAMMQAAHQGPTCTKTKRFWNSSDTWTLWLAFCGVFPLQMSARRVRGHCVYAHWKQSNLASAGLQVQRADFATPQIENLPWAKRSKHQNLY